MCLRITRKSGKQTHQQRLGDIDESASDLREFGFDNKNGLFCRNKHATPLGTQTMSMAALGEWPQQTHTTPASIVAKWKTLCLVMHNGLENNLPTLIARSV